RRAADHGVGAPARERGPEHFVAVRRHPAAPEGERSPQAGARPRPAADNGPAPNRPRDGGAPHAPMREPQLGQPVYESAPAAPTGSGPAPPGDRQLMPAPGAVAPEPAAPGAG